MFCRNPCVHGRERVGKSVRLDGESGTFAVAGEYMRQSARHAKLGESRCGIVHDALLGIFGRIIDIGHSGLSFRYCAVCANYPTVPHGVHFRHADVCRASNPVNVVGCERRPVLATLINYQRSRAMASSACRRADRAARLTSEPMKSYTDSSHATWLCAVPETAFPKGVSRRKSPRTRRRTVR